MQLFFFSFAVYSSELYYCRLAGCYKRQAFNPLLSDNSAKQLVEFMKLSDLKGFGKKTEEILPKVGISTVEEFMAADPFEVYKQLKESVPGISLNALYAMIGAQEGVDWREIAKTRRTEILIILDDLGLAPR